MDDLLLCEGVFCLTTAKADLNMRDPGLQKR